MLTPVERVLILKGADLLKDVGPRHLLGLANVAREIPIYESDTIYLEDDPADALYIVVEGRVRLSTDGRVTSEVGPGEAFGTWSLVDDSARGHRAECVEDGLTLALHREEFYDVASADVAILKELVRVLAKRLRQLAAVAAPEEARVEGEGIEKPEARTVTESKEEAASQAEAVAASPGSALAAAAAGKPVPIESEDAEGEQDAASVATPALDPVVAPEPIIPPGAPAETEAPRSPRTRPRRT
jgi:CRP-like cAMP-binding protein